MSTKHSMRQQKKNANTFVVIITVYRLNQLKGNLSDMIFFNLKKCNYLAVRVRQNIETENLKVREF